MGFQCHQQGGSELGAQDAGTQDPRLQVWTREPSSDAASSPRAGHPHPASSALSSSTSSCHFIAALRGPDALPRRILQDAGPERSNRDGQYIRGECLYVIVNCA